MRILFATILLVLSVPAYGKPVEYDRHAIYSVGSEAVITERAVRKVKTAGLKQIRKKKKYKQAPASSSTASAPLVEKARAFLGTNPTGWSRVWCGRFMAMIAPELARRVKNPNWARDWADLPKTAPQVGAIVVLTRGRGGHIGVVTGFDSNGNPRVVSGNHNRRVAESVYSKHRVIAYVSGG